MKVGSIIQYYGILTDINFLLCDGLTFNELLYPELYDFLGSNTLPNFQGCVLRMRDTTANRDKDGTRDIGNF